MSDLFDPEFGSGRTADDKLALTGSILANLRITAPSTGNLTRIYRRFEDVNVVLQGVNWNVNAVALRPGQSEPDQFMLDIDVRNSVTQIHISDFQFTMLQFSGEPVLVTNDAPRTLNLAFQQYAYSENEPLWRIEANSFLTVATAN